MKKIILSLVSLVLIFSIVGCSASYPENVRKDIYERTAKYGIELNKEVDDLKSNGKKHSPTKLSGEIVNFVDKYSIQDLTNQEKELLDKLITSTNSYVNMIENQAQGDLSGFVFNLDKFDKSMKYLTNYYTNK